MTKTPRAGAAPRRARARNARGQAMVEMVLGLLVFITLITFAIFFSETIFTSLKVQEAATSAMWDSTGGKMHDWPALLFFGTGEAKKTVKKATQSAQQRYADFDGRTGVNGATTVLQTFSRAQNLSVSCGLGKGKDYPGLLSAGTIATIGVYADNGGLNCNSEASLDAFNMPNSFLDSGKRTFREQNYKNPSLRICGFGRAIGGSCKGSYSMLLDDWGLAGNGGPLGESGICAMVPNIFGGSVALPCAPNLRYYSMTRLVYEPSSLLVNKGAASALAKAIVGTSPIDEDSMWMSFMGEETMFLQPVAPTDGLLPIMPWPTNPGGASILMPWYANSYSKRDKCFLGKKCN